MMKKFLAVASFATLLFTGVAQAQSYEGGWLYDTNPEFMVLGDDSDGTGLHLGTATGWCGSQGTGYSQMHRILQRNGDGPISWWVDQECDDGRKDYIRVCIQNWQGQTGCSTYENFGWRDWFLD